jgi:hypothetical protein
MTSNSVFRARRWVAGAALGAALVGCGAPGASDGAGDVGEVMLALTQVPGDVSCLSVTAQGATRSVTKLVDLRVGDSSVNLPLGGLPLGKVTFVADAFGEHCSDVTSASVATWLSDPTDASVILGSVANVVLKLVRNGRAGVVADFGDEPACSPIGMACLSGSECCGGSCAAGVCAVACSPVDLALNASGSGYPSPLMSDAGWGGGSYPWQILQGHTSYTDTWAHGLAFTGGALGYGGQACGRRQATVDFGDGNPRTFNRVLAWHHGAEHVPTSYHVEYWDGSAWVNAGGTSTHRTDLADYAVGWGSEPTETIFPKVTATRARFVIDSNCDITHGWLYSLQIFSACAE